MKVKIKDYEKKGRKAFVIKQTTIIGRDMKETNLFNDTHISRVPNEENVNLTGWANIIFDERNKQIKYRHLSSSNAVTIYNKADGYENGTEVGLLEEVTLENRDIIFFGTKEQRDNCNLSFFIKIYYSKEEKKLIKMFNHSNHPRQKLIKNKSKLVLKFISALIHLLFLLSEIALAYLMRNNHFNDKEYIAYTLMGIILAIFVMYLFKNEIRSRRNKKKLLKEVSKRLNIKGQMGGYVVKFCIVKEEKMVGVETVYRYTGLSLAYYRGENNQGKSMFYSTNAVILKRGKFDRIMKRKKDDLKFHNFDVEISDAVKFDDLFKEVGEGFTYSQGQSRKNGFHFALFYSLFYSMGLKLFITAIVFAVFSFIFEYFVDGVIASTITVIGIDKVITWFTGVGNIQIKGGQNGNSKYTKITISKNSYYARTDDVLFLYSDFESKY